MFYSGADQKYGGTKGVAIFINNKWQQKVQYHYEHERIIYTEIQYDCTQLIVLSAYTLKNGKKEETGTLHC